MKKSQARVAAQLRGDKTYVPEQPCARGHSLRMVGTGTCTACRKQTELVRTRANRNAYNIRKKNERAPKLALLAAKMRSARASETPEARLLRLEKAKLKQRIWRAANTKHAGTAAAKKRYKAANPGKVRADCIRRRVSKLHRTPAWLTVDDLWMIEQAYDLAVLRTKLFGFSWHVDHVLPLQGKFVSGLHVPTNLQVISAKDNVRKANRFTPA